jgi:acetyltransferase-like isoleucine patch superfamily enzyme
MNPNIVSSTRLQRFQELFFTTLFGDIPTILLGTKLRNLFYRNIFARMGKSNYIQHGVEFLGACNIYLGNAVYIHRNTRIDTRGHQNNKLTLRDGVVLDLGVCIGGFEDTHIELHERTYIGSYVCISGPGDIKIGKDCMIASHTGIYANNHNFADTEIRIAHQGVNTKGIVIEDDCWLGNGVTVLDGVTIGRGSVIGAGSVVNKDIPPFSVAVGVPTKVIKSRKKNELQKLTN